MAMLNGEKMKIYCLHADNNLGHPTTFYASQDLARKALRKKRDELKRRPLNLIVEDTDDVFAFIGGGWAEYRVAWKVREIDVIG
jgi:hypothetical protein